MYKHKEIFLAKIKNPLLAKGFFIGKVERSHGTDQREFYQLLTYKDNVDLHAKLAEWEAFYNCHRLQIG